MNASKYDSQYNLRLYEADKERFTALRKHLKLTPRDCLVTLMDYYNEEHEDECLGEEITLLMQAKVQGGKNTELRKIVFRGKVKYSNPDPYCYPVDAETAEKLKMEFGLDMRLCDAIYYLFRPKLTAYWHDEKACFLVHEELDVWVNRNEVDWDAIYYGRMPEHPLSVKRCSFIKDYDELCYKFRKYAQSVDLNGLATIMAKNIGQNYLLMNELFGV